MFYKNKKGFTLIELLIVIAIIGLLATLVIVKTNGYLKKARDSKRLSDLEQIKNALEMYYVDNGEYPHVRINYVRTGSETDGCGTSGSWCKLEKVLNGTDIDDVTPGDQAGNNYIPILPRDPLGLQDEYQYYYDSDTGDSYQSYGLMARLESESNYSKVTNDNGQNNSITGPDEGLGYEIGSQPSYCKEKYNGDWKFGSPGWPESFVCQSGD